MKKIIVPTDFSDNAKKALDVAVEIARRSQGEIVVFNAYDLPYSQNVMTTALLDVMKENSENGLEIISETLKDSGVKFRTEARLGNPIRAVKDLVQKESADLVVLGTKGASGIEEVLIGSNAASILHAVKAPVLAIPEKGTIDDWKEIVYAIDLNHKGEEEALKHLRSLALLFNSKISVVHVQREGDKELKVIDKHFYAKALEGIELDYHVIDEDGDVEKTILDFAEANQKDIIVLLARKYGFLQGIFHNSMTSKVAYHSKLPFMTLHEA
jgi:nucleotide-binding universal stress UspA family protein